MENEALADELAQRICAYHVLNQLLVESECILVLGSNDPRVAERGAELYLERWAPLMVVSGNVGALTEGLYGKPEAEYFAEIAIAKGVPQERILVEALARNTGENLRFSRELLLRNGLDPKAFILVQKPYMERRAYATFKRYLPDRDVVVTSPEISYAEYPLPHLPKKKLISIVVGDLQRMWLYPKLGFQIEQQIPADVWECYERLVAMGYTEHLVVGAPISPA